MAATAEASGEEDAIAVFVTAPSTEVARKIASVLVEKRLAACVNIVPGIESIYEWQGKVSGLLLALFLHLPWHSVCFRWSRSVDISES